MELALLEQLELKSARSCLDGETSSLTLVDKLPHSSLDRLFSFDFLETGRIVRNSGWLALRSRQQLGNGPCSFQD